MRGLIVRLGIVAVLAATTWLVDVPAVYIMATDTPEIADSDAKSDTTQAQDNAFPPPPADMRPMPAEPAKGGYDYFTQYLIDNALDKLHWGDEYQARVFIEKALENNPGDPFLLRSLIYFFENDGYWSVAEGYLSRLLERYPYDANALMRRGYARYRMQHITAALADLQTALDLKLLTPAETEYVESLLVVVREANAEVERIVAEEWAAIQRRVRELEEAGDSGELERYYTELAETDAHFVYALTARGYLRLRLGRVEEAQADFDAVLQRGGEDAADRREMEAVIERIYAARQTQEEFAEVRAETARLQAEGDPVAQERYYTELTARDDFRTYGHFLRGFLRLGLNRNEEARADFEIALADESLDPAARRDAKTAVERATAASRAEQEWRVIQDRIRDLRREGRYESLHRYLEALESNAELRTFALSIAGLTHFRQAEYRAADMDFFEVMIAVDAVGEPEDIVDVMLSVENGESNPEEWARIIDAVRFFQSAGQKDSLEEYLTALLRRNIFEEAILVGRAMVRRENGDTEGYDADAKTLREMGGPAAEAALERIDGYWRRQSAATKARLDLTEARHRVAEYEAANDMTGLETYLTQLVDDETLPAFAYGMRGRLRLRQGRNDEAEEDFAALLAHAGERRSASRMALERSEAEEAAAARWRDIHEKAREYEARGDFVGLDAFYTELATTPGQEAYAIAARGYVRMGQNRMDGALDDFEQVLLLRNLDDNIRLDVVVTLARLTAVHIAEDEWKSIVKRAEELNAADDYDGLERLYSERLAIRSADVYSYAGRGFARYGKGEFEAAVADFEQALAGDGLDDETREQVAAARAEIRVALDSGGTPTSPKLYDDFARVDKLIEQGDYTTATQILDEIEAMDMGLEQRAVFDYLYADILWKRGQRDEAYIMYRQAATELKEPFRLSEAQWKMAEYHWDKGEKDRAIDFGRVAVASNPEYSWRNAQLAMWFFELRRDDEAIYYLARAMEGDERQVGEAGLYQLMANAYMRKNDKAQFHYYMERHIDYTSADHVSREKNPTEHYESLYHARFANDNAMRRFRGSSYIYSTFFRNDDYSLDWVTNLYWRVTPFRMMNVEAFVQTVGTIASSFSDEYYNPWTNSAMGYSGHSHLSDTFRVAIGLRANLPKGFGLSLDKVFGIGRDAEDDTRLRLDYFAGKGVGLEPSKVEWNYASFYTEGTWSIQHSDFTLFADARIGRSYRLYRISDRVVFTPFVGAFATYGGKEIEHARRYGLEAGPGVMLRRWNRGTTYREPRSFFEMSLQYRFGLSNKREDVWAFNLGYTF
ncbi:MAG: hypothetical protein LUC93_15380 [Planctomycetaceae bacterium]|nr:hypothetical protein [Planctomycetaceae bacterium]